jgi:signal peptidase II
VAKSRSSFSQQSSNKLIFWLSITLLIILADQLTKFFTLNQITVQGPKKINAFINWVLVYNPGAAFSFLADGSGWQKWLFIGIASFAAIVMLWLLWRHSNQRIFCFSISLILGGAVGNLIDRFVHGAVVDFIDVYYLSYHWPAFNVADSAITVGTALLIMDELVRVIKRR